MSEQQSHLNSLLNLPTFFFAEEETQIEGRVKYLLLNFS